MSVFHPEPTDPSKCWSCGQHRLTHVGGLEECLEPIVAHMEPRGIIDDTPDHGIYVRGWDGYDWDRYHKWDR